MKKRITLAFALIFALFTAGAGVTLYNLINTTASLRYLIGLHEVEDIRQELFSHVQRVSAYIYGAGPVFSEHRDEIIANTEKMHHAIRRCNDCHHEPEVLAELAETMQMIDAFEVQFNALVTLADGFERRHQKQEEVYLASSNILARVQDMVNRAAASIDNKTQLAMDQMTKVYALIGGTLALAFLLALVVAHNLARSITGPIDSLVGSTRKIAAGQWGHQNTIAATDEMRELVDAFNLMSATLAENKVLEQQHLEELHRTQQQLIEAEKLTALGTLAGGIAHDFNNILCGMIGHLSVLAREIPPNEEHRKTIETIEKAGFRAAGLVKQLLAFARQKPMQIAPLDLGTILEAIVQRLRSSLEAKILIDLHQETHLPAVNGDADQLEQAIVNLCRNAQDAMPEGGTLSIDARAVSLDEGFASQYPGAKAGEHVLLTVQDTGTGINHKILPRIFDPFFTTKAVGKGTGLGLAMVYGIIKSHKGFCIIESTPGQGTTFRAYLPVAEKHISEHPRQAPASVSLAGRTILIVDDEELVTSMLSHFLKDLGCRTMIAHNGRLAVDIFRERHDEIDLVILDIIMPVMNGKQTLEELIKIRPKVKVLVSSGYVMNTETQEMLNLGARGFLQKPYDMTEARRTISEILGSA